MNSRNLWPALFILAILIGIGFRLPALENRPMHSDEAVHAVKFGALLEDGDYRYDPYEFHGPSLNYLTLIPAWIDSKKKLNEVDESTLRIVPLFFGILLISLLIFLKDGLGWPVVAAAALFTAVSPSMVFYSRYYIQEMLLACFSFGAIVFGYQSYKDKKITWALVTGLFLGLMHATKETFLIPVSAMILAVLAAKILDHYTRKENQPHKGNRSNGTNCNKKFMFRLLFAVFAAASTVSILFYSSFFSNQQGIIDSILTYKTYFARAGENEWHIHPWYFYFQRLLFFKQYASPLWSEALIAILAIWGIRFVFSNHHQDSRIDRNLLRFFAFYAMFMSIAFSLIPYKTPWNLLGFWHGFIIMAGVGATKLISEIGRASAKMVVALLLISGSLQLAWQSYLANFEYEADPANPFVYAHPTKDVLAMAQRIKAYVQAAPNGQNTYIQFICSNAD
ncbi:MAG: flippase activity-associated protein Agl23, partial [bacterium]